MKHDYSARGWDIRAKKAHPLDWVLEPLEEHPGYMRRRMFGGEAAYMDGRLSLMLTDGEEPWNGLLVVTGREFHAALMAQWKQLKPHEVLGKWLYISQGNPAFETVAPAIVESIRHGDARIGVEPKARKKKRGNLTTKNTKGEKAKGRTPIKKTKKITR